MNMQDPRREGRPPDPVPGTPPSTSQPNVVQVRYKAAVQTPWVTYVLLGFTILIYLMQIASQYFFDGIDYPAFLGMKINEYILAGEYWRLLTPMFLHGSVLHILFNMYALYAFGAGLERHYGHGRYFALYLLGGLAGNIVSFLLSTKPSLGASTAIFGLVAAEGVFIFRNRFLFGQRYRSAISNIVMIVGINLLMGLSPGIDNWGHLGGLLGGLAFAWFAGPVLKMEGIYPDLKLADEQNNPSRAWQIFVVELLVLVGLSILPFLR
jgi:rhomboid protease GluP